MQGQGKAFLHRHHLRRVIINGRELGMEDRDLCPSRCVAVAKIFPRLCSQLSIVPEVLGLVVGLSTSQQITHFVGLGEIESWKHSRSPSILPCRIAVTHLAAPVLPSSGFSLEYHVQKVGA